MAHHIAPPFSSRLSIGVSRGGIFTLEILFYYLNVRSSVGVPPRHHHRIPLLFLVLTCDRQSGISSSFIDRCSPPLPVTTWVAEYTIEHRKALSHKGAY